jgi:short-subunit dehydrogenase
MSSDWTGKIVLITGASRGIGRACAARFAEQGANVVLASRSKEDLEATRISLANGNRILVVPTDVTDLFQVKQLFQKVKSEFGHLDVLVNNAGRSMSGSVAEIDLEKIEFLFRLNFFAPLWCIQEAIPMMKEQGAGHIVNISSIAGKRGVPFYGAYCASKAALNGLTESLRVELKNTNIKVLLVCPGGTETDFYNDGLHSTPNDFKLPKDKLMTPEKVSSDILSALSKGKGEVIIGEKGKVLVFLSKVSYSLVDFLLGKVFKVS